MSRIYNTYTLPIKLPRNKYGTTTNTSFISSSNDLFSNSNYATAISMGDSGSGGGEGSTYIPDFIGATNEFDGVRGLVPAPLAGMQDYYLHGDGEWNKIPIMKPASESGFGGKEGLAPAPPVGSYDLYLTGGGNWTRPSVFTPATRVEDGLQGEVPAPAMGIGDYYLLESTGNWVYNAAQKWLYEWPDDSGIEPSGLGIDGDFNVSKTLSTFNLEVEGRAHFWELVIDRVKANEGQLLVSPSNFRVDDIGPTILYYIDEEPIVSILNYRPDIKRALENENVDAIGIKCQRVFMRNDDGDNSIVPSVTVGDMMRCRTMNLGPGEYENEVSNKDYWTFVLGVGSEQYREIPEGYDSSYGSANYIDLAISILTEDEALPIDTVIEDDGTIDVPTYFDPTYTIADLKDISEQVRTGNHDRMEEFPTQYEMDQITVAVLNLPDIPIPSELINVDDYIFHYEPEVNHEQVSGDVPWYSEDWASELNKYNNDDLYKDWQFGYGKIEISIGDNLACLGHLFDRDRRNAIIISANTPIDPELVAPSIAQYAGIDIFGLSISRFRLTTIAKNGNKFYGWFGVESGSNPGSYFSITDVIASSVQEALYDAYSYAYNLAYSYSMQAYDMMLSYVTNNYATTEALQTAYGFFQSAYNRANDAYTLSSQTYGYFQTLAYDLGYYSTLTQDALGIGISAYNLAYGSYSYSLFSADKISSYVYSAYGYLTAWNQTAYGFIQEASTAAGDAKSYTEQTYSYIKTWVNNLNGDYTQEIQNAYGWARQAYSYAGQSYSYSLQSAYEIRNDVFDLSSYTHSYVQILSDEINMAISYSVGKDELELVGIHLDGDNSTVNIVGSLDVHQNYDDETDTIKIYDDYDILRVEITPEEIPAKSELDIAEITHSLGWKSIRDTLAKDVDSRNRTIQYINKYKIPTAEPTIAHTGDIIKLIDPSLTLIFDTNGINNSNYISSWECYFKVETVNGDSIISEHVDGSGAPIAYTLSSNSVKFYKRGTFSSGQLSNNFDGKEIQITFFANITFTSSAPNVNTYWNVSPDNWRRDGVLKITPASGISDTSFMQIGSNGFYYSYTGDYYLYSGVDGFEVKNNENLISVVEDDVKICRSAYSSDLGDLWLQRGHYNSILYCTANSFNGVWQDRNIGQRVRIGSVAQFGLGRELTVVGYREMLIQAHDPIWIYSYLDRYGNRIDKKLTSEQGLLLTYTDADQTAESYTYLINTDGVVKFLALSDGWHLISK